MLNKAKNEKNTYICYLFDEMGNVATSIKEQIKKLQERGMELDCSIEKVEETLLDIGYFRLGFYWNPFEIDNHHNFRKGTKFSTAVYLYYLDVDLRNILLKYINRIEVNFRTKIIFTISNKYKDSPTWFSDPKIMKPKHVNDFDKFYYNSFTYKKGNTIHYKNNIIRQHHTKYINDKYAPAWKTLEFFPFGSIFHLFRYLKNIEDKKSITSFFNIKSVGVFENYMKAIVDLRNRCAHGSVLFDYKAEKGISIIQGLNFNKGNSGYKQSLHSIIVIVLFILSNISKNREEELKEQLEKKLYEAVEANPDVKDIIVKKMGFHKDYFK